MEPARILVVDDEENISHLVSSGLRLEGFEVATASSSSEAEALLARRMPDLLVLDLMLDNTGRPDGLAVLAKLRNSGSTLPAIVLTGHDSVQDRVAALRAGADDWVPKPFVLEELLARVHAVLRRAGRGVSAPGPLLQVADLRMYDHSREVVRGDRRIALTRTEFELLRLLMRNERIVMPRAVILDRVWNHDFPGPTKSVEIYIGYLRRKIDATGPPLIHTVRGVGYVIRPPHPDEDPPQ